MILLPPGRLLCTSSHSGLLWLTVTLWGMKQRATLGCHHACLSRGTLGSQPLLLGSFLGLQTLLLRAVLSAQARFPRGALPTQTLKKVFLPVHVQAQLLQFAHTALLAVLDLEELLHLLDLLVLQRFYVLLHLSLDPDELLQPRSVSLALLRSFGLGREEEKEVGGKDGNESSHH